MMKVQSRKRKHFGHIIKAENLCTSILSTAREEERGDVGLMASKTR